MAGRAYTVTMDAISITVARDLIAWTVGAAIGFILDKVTVTQETQTSSEALAVQIQRGSDAGTGTAATELPTDPGDAAAGTVMISDLSTLQTATDILHREGWNVLAPMIWHPTPEERFVWGGGDFGAVRLDVAPGSAMVVTCTVAWRELG